MKNKEIIVLFSFVFLGATLLLEGNATSADTVVVVPLGGAIGNAAASDVIKGKTFSSKAAGKGVTGTLNLPPTIQTYTTPTYGMTFNLIPAGTFTMGSPDGLGSEPEEAGRSPEEIQHQVTLTKPFYIQTTEVTQQQWRDVVLTAEVSGYISVGVLDEEPSNNHSGSYKPNYPVDSISINHIRDWLIALNQLTGKNGCGSTPNTCYILPTEAQWEYAARGGTTTAYATPYSFDTSYYGTVIDHNFNSNAYAMGWYLYNRLAPYPDNSKPVAQKQANRWGLYDMHGNMWEICKDWYDPDYYTKPGNNIDPQGPSEPVISQKYVFRGGSFLNNASSLRSAYRRGIQADGSFATGFRLVLPPGQ